MALHPRRLESLEALLCGLQIVLAYTTCCLLIYFPRPVSLIACFFLYLKYPLCFVLIICINPVYLLLVFI